MLAFLWASDGGRVWRWLAPGALLGLTTLTRPEYLPFVALFALLALARVWLGHRRGLLPGLAAAALLVAAFCGVLAPWTARNAIVLDRFVPVTTGGGKALFVATYLPGDGRQQLVKRQLIERYYGKKDLPYTEVLQTEMEPLLNRVAKKYPDLGRDAALARIGRENFVEVRQRAAARLRLDGDPQDPEHVGPRIVGRDVAEVLVRVPQDARVLGARGAARARLPAPLGGRPDRPHDPRHHADRRPACWPSRGARCR